MTRNKYRKDPDDDSSEKRQAATSGGGFVEYMRDVSRTIGETRLARVTGLNEVFGVKDTRQQRGIKPSPPPPPAKAKAKK